MNLAEALNTIALLLPGYFGAWTMGFILGRRKREWPEMTLYSLVFSGLTYYVLLRLTPPVLAGLLNSMGWDLSGFQRALNEISNIGDRRFKLTFHNIVKVIPPAAFVAFLLGAISGVMRRSMWFKRLIGSFTNRTQNADIWTDFHELYNKGPHTVILKNGDTYYGLILMVSDTLTGADRGIIMHNPVCFDINPIEAQFSGVRVRTLTTPGPMLLFADQIAMIYDNANSKISISLRRQLARLIKRANRRVGFARFWRRVRVAWRRITR